jgi:DNA-binding response OmpR family regulator
MLFTGDTNPMLEDEARNAGADDYLVKPVEPMLLEERCWALVGRSARIPG